ncbi:tetratricopeptide repeat protein [Sphingomonas glacialis]|uniref:Tetratricopeptide repeat protein n=1 Tax=Sphingomonas glacialis TaxID=658225 RepID=A0A502FWC7_9SPHN|nr:tetratricopeptide repeat protein [Sphingomonas glacialis]TPG53957.1 tetratricopeptide repeat protein [Sphingomonas glacialis]
MGGRTWIALALLIAAPTAGVATQTGADVDEAQKASLDTASRALLDGHPDEALTRIEPVIAAYRSAYAAETRQTYCGMSTAQTLAYMALATSEKHDAVALGPGYCEALYVKGFALVDLKRLPEARAVYEQVVTLAPMHAHFLTELGQTYRPDRNWPKMLDLCTKAAGLADLAPPEKVASEHSFAWRCMGYALTEQGKYDESEALYRKCLEVDPNDAKAKSELSYIAEQRRKKV